MIYDELFIILILFVGMFHTVEYCMCGGYSHPLAHACHVFIRLHAFVHQVSHEDARLYVFAYVSDAFHGEMRDYGREHAAGRYDEHVGVLEDSFGKYLLWFGVYPQFSYLVIGVEAFVDFILFIDYDGFDALHFCVQIRVIVCYGVGFSHRS